MKHPRLFLVLLGWAMCGAVVGAAGEELPPRVLPGLQADGSILLHNQWPIRPVGRQVELGDFPVNMAVDPSGRWVAVLHAGYTPHELRIVDLKSGQTTAIAPLHQTFRGLAFSSDGREIFCSGAADAVLHVFRFGDGVLTPLPDVPVCAKDTRGVISGVALARHNTVAIAARLFDNQVFCVDATTGAPSWAVTLGGGPDMLAYAFSPEAAMNRPKVYPKVGLVRGDEPLDIAVDSHRGKVYVSLWGKSAVAVLNAADGRLLGRWDCGLHPNELLLSRDRRRLFISDSGVNAVTVLSTDDGHPIETLSTSMAPDDLPGSMPNSMALSPDGRMLYVANASNNNVAVFDVSDSGHARPVGFIPAGWFPTCVRITPNGRQLLVISGRGLTPKSDNSGSPTKWTNIGKLYHGSLAIIDLPKGDAFDGALAAWTRVAETCRPAPAVEPAADTNNPIPGQLGGASPIRYVIYIIKENRTYDQIFGDMKEGNGDPSLCLFPENVTPNIHAIARHFVLLDNFYANAEVSAGGHEWSTAAFSSDFVEKLWPPEYGHQIRSLPYPAEGTHEAAVPKLGYIWDRAAAAGVSYRSYGEFATLGRDPALPVISNLPSLQGHIDPRYQGWNLNYHDIDRAAEFISELHRFAVEGGMPRLQIVRLPQDHTAGGWAGAWTPAAMEADNDLALGRIVEAVSHSKFWPQTAIFIVEDDAQNGPDHVDAHRTEALVVSPYVRRHAVDSTAYTSCSMLHSIELILGLQPMSQFDTAARPMWASFMSAPDLTPYSALPARIDIEQKNPAKTHAARMSSRLNFTHEDANDDQLFNRIIWETVRGPGSVMPAPVHAAFVRPFAKGDDDDDD